MSREMIKGEGNFSGAIENAEIIENRFGKGGYEVKLYVVTPDNKEAHLYLDLSQEYAKGKNSHLMQYQLSFEALNKLGLPGQELAQIKVVVGKSVDFFGQTSTSNGKEYTNYYISNRPPEKVVDPAMVQQMFQSPQAQQPATGFTQTQAQPQQAGFAQPQPQAQQPIASPFAQAAPAPQVQQ